MKLRNKRTGEIYEPTSLIEFTYEDDSDYWAAQYDSLAKLNEEWEDYTPAEPLIKDEKIRKAVRAWADANGYEKVEVTFGAVNELDGYNLIRFETTDIVDPKKLGIYTITELCGEE